MLKFIARRVILMIPTLIAISIVTFFLIQLPPGDFLTTLVASMAEQGETVDQSRLDSLRDRYGLDDPFYIQYFKWMGGVLQGDFGYSFTWNRPVSDLVWDRVGYSFALSISSLIMIWLIAFPIGVYSAVRKYSIGDYIVTFFGFLGLAIPNFLIALVLMYVSFKYFGQSVGGLFSPEYVDAPWSLARLGDFLLHLWIPMIIVGTAGTASLIRITRANLLDELGRPYVVTARAKGLPEHRVLLKYPVRMALNPFVSTVGWVLPGLISGETIISVVLSLPTTGPLLLRALTSQDMYLAGGFILILSVLTVIGTLISDIMLAWLDPRIRYQYG
ncbi:MAG: ABC transporter permease [Thermomicrobiales bacterium]